MQILTRETRERAKGREGESKEHAWQVGAGKEEMERKGGGGGRQGVGGRGGVGEVRNQAWERWETNGVGEGNRWEAGGEGKRGGGE